MCPSPLNTASSSTPATWAVISSRPTPGTLTSGPLHWLFTQLRILFPQYHVAPSLWIMLLFAPPTIWPSKFHLSLS